MRRVAPHVPSSAWPGEFESCHALVEVQLRQERELKVEIERRLKVAEAGHSALLEALAHESRRTWNI